MDLYSSLCTITKEENILRDEPMCRHTTFRVGGPADYFVTPQSVEEIRGILAVCRKENVPYYIVGNGSNLLVGDGGFRGVVLQIFKKMNDVRVEGERVTAQAGVLLSKVASAAYNASLTGLEFAAGIPGTLGGAVRMNAGAYGGEMKQVLESAVVLTQEGELLTIPVEELGLAYRTSVVEKKDYVVVEATLGDAQVSEKHCGFVINRGNATAAQVCELMQEVVKKVKETSGVTLEPEVKRIGEF